MKEKAIYKVAQLDKFRQKWGGKSPRMGIQGRDLAMKDTGDMSYILAHMIFLCAF